MGILLVICVIHIVIEQILSYIAKKDNTTGGEMESYHLDAYVFEIEIWLN